MDKIQWQSHGHVYWMVLTEPTFPNLIAGIEKSMAPAVRFRILIGATRQGTRLLQEDSKKALPLAERIRITNSRLVHICWSLNPPSKPMDLLVCYHRRNDIEEGTPPPGQIRFAPRDNWGPRQTPRMTGPMLAIMDRAQVATSKSHPLGPQSEPPHQRPPGAIILQK